jgi:hypothetical protein
MPGTKHKHTAKWRRCVEEVQSKNPSVDAYAVCTAQLGPSLLSDDMPDEDDGQPFAWNGSGSLGKPFKKRVVNGSVAAYSALDLTSESAAKAWKSRQRSKPPDQSKNPAPYHPAPGEKYKPTHGPERDAEVGKLIEEARQASVNHGTAITAHEAASNEHRIAAEANIAAAKTPAKSRAREIADVRSSRAEDLSKKADSITKAIKDAGPRVRSESADAVKHADVASRLNILEGEHGMAAERHKAAAKAHAAAAVSHRLHAKKK